MGTLIFQIGVQCAVFRGFTFLSLILMLLSFVKAMVPKRAIKIVLASSVSPMPKQCENILKMIFHLQAI